MTSIAIDQTACTRCGACVELCTGHVFARSEERVEAARPEDCWLCGHCVAVCPVDAVRHSGYPLEECPPLDSAVLPSLDALVAILRERRSARVFRDRCVPRELVRQLVDVARWAPSAHNGQPVDWLAIDAPQQIAVLSAQTVAALGAMVRPVTHPLQRHLVRIAMRPKGFAQALELAASVQRMAERQARGDDPIFRHAPLVLIAHVPGRDTFGRDDAVYAAYNLMLAAQRIGLGACQIGYFMVALANSRELRGALGLPEGRRAQVALILGYPKYRFRRALVRRTPNLTWGVPNT